MTEDNTTAKVHNQMGSTARLIGSISGLKKLAFSSEVTVLEPDLTIIAHSIKHQKIQKPAAESTSY